MVIALLLARVREHPDRQRAWLLRGDRRRGRGRAARSTLLPALLGAARADGSTSLKVPFGGAHHEDDQPHGWARWAEGVAERPWPALIVAIVAAGRARDPAQGHAPRPAGRRPAARIDTTARQAYDPIAKAFGAGTNGPFLVAVSLDPPAQADTKKLNQLKQKAAEAATTGAGQGAKAGPSGDPRPDPAADRRGRAARPGPGQATQQAQAEATKAQQPSKQKQKQLNEQKQFLKSTGQRPAPDQAREQDRQGQGRRHGLAPGGQGSGIGGRLLRVPEDRALGRSDRERRQAACATT